MTLTLTLTLTLWRTPQARMTRTLQGSEVLRHIPDESVHRTANSAPQLAATKGGHRE
jgi:hypothetical protein